MLKINPPNYKFCPFCGKELTTKIDEGRKWKYCESDNWTYYPHAFQAAVSIIIHANKILLVKRNREPYKGKWMIPAGFLNFGEHPKDCVLRETEEETGLIVEKAELFDVLQSDDDPRSLGTLGFYYLVKVTGSIKNGDNTENSDIKWFEFDNIPPLAWKNDKTIIERLAKNTSLDSKGSTN